MVVVGIFALLFACFALYRTWSYTNFYTTSLLKSEAKLALQFDLAIREYVAQFVRPYAEKHVGEDDFIPEIMSTSFVARTIFEDVQKEIPGIVIKFSSDDPRNPINRAGPEELKLIRYFNENPGTKEWTGEIDLAGKRYQAHFRARRMKEECLRCHGDPRDAPRSMLEQYGDKGGFHRMVGKVMALDTIAIPSSEYQAMAARGMRFESFVLVVGICLLLAGIYWIFNFMVARRLEILSHHFKEVVEKGPDSLISPVDISGGDEIGLMAESFNLMAKRLRTMCGSLENQVALRTGELSKSEERYRTLVEESFDGIFVQMGSRIIFANRRLHEMLGYENDELVGMDHWLIYHPEYHEITRERARVRMRGEDVPTHYEVKLQRKNGTWFYGDIAARVVQVEGEPGIQVWVRDIMERKQAEDALRSEEEKFRILVEESPFGVSWIGADGAYKYVNPKFVEIFGYSLEEIPTGREWFKRAYPNSEYRRKVISTWKIDMASAAPGAVRPQPFTVTCKNGSLKTINFRSVTIDSGDQFIIYENISEKRRLETQLRQAQKMEAIGTLAGGIAHDFNNILSAIIGMSELARMEAPEGSSLHRHIDQVIKSGNRASSLVKQILAFSRQKEQSHIPMSIKPIAREALSLLRSSISSNIEIRQNIGTGIGLIEGDPTQIHQIIMNLCTNAEHAMREKGGVMEVVLGNRECGMDDLKTHPNLHVGPYICLSVSDTGYGIDEETINRIFDPYFTTKGVGEGTGLGLAVVQGIVHKQGGEITVKSEPGRGTTFEVWFPVIEGEKDEIEEKTEASLPTGDEHILFVDDEKILAEVGKEILEHLGYEVTTRTSSLEALELFKAKPEFFDLVITDMSMPNITGEQLSREFMKIRPDIPIILCTGFSHIISKEKARGVGIKAFVMKPLVTKDLAETVRKALDEK